MGTAREAPTDLNVAETPGSRQADRTPSRMRKLLGAPITADVATVYLVIALVWGFVLVGLVPPFQVPDEPAHFYRAWQLAGLGYGSASDGLVDIPKSVADLPTDLGSGRASGVLVNGYSPARIRSYLFAPIGAQPATVDNASAYGPIGYVPHLLPIALARLTGRGALTAFYAVRVLNLLAATLLIYLAIRVIPVGKLLIAVLGLLPMTMYEMASVSPDALAIAGSLLFAALLVRAMMRACLGWRDVALLAAAATLGLNVKPGYAVLVVATLAISKSALGTWRRYLAAMAAVIGSTIAVALALIVTTPPRTPAALVRILGSDHGVDPARQLDFLVSHPWTFAAVLQSTLDRWWQDYAIQFIGRFGWLTFSLPSAVVVLVFAVVLIAFASPDDYAPAWWQRAVLVGAAALACTTLAVALYIGFTPVGFGRVNGLQGRYFIPCAPFLFFGLYRASFARMNRRLVFVFCAVGVVALATIATILQFYYF